MTANRIRIEIVIVKWILIARQHTRAISICRDFDFKTINFRLRTIESRENEKHLINHI